MATISEDFKSIAANGKYLFHFHTDYTDGSSKVEDYFEYASLRKYEAIIFTEHVRKHISYNFDDFLQEIQAVKRRFPDIKTFVGVEAKVLPGGGLDISAEILSRIQVICFACHSFPKDVELYRESLKMLFADEKWSRYIRVWVHPGRFLKRQELLDSSVETIMDLTAFAERQEIYIEKNIREGLPPGIVLHNISSERILTGYDAHSVGELGRLQQ